MSLAQFALAWVLRQPNVAAAIIGASKPAQFDEMLRLRAARSGRIRFAKAKHIPAQVKAA